MTKTPDSIIPIAEVTDPSKVRVMLDRPDYLNSVPLDKMGIAFTVEADYTPVIIGSTTAGTGTYTTQNGRTTKVGRLVFFQIDVAWTAHTGTGNIQFSLPPFVSGGSINTLLSIATEGLAFANQLQATTIAGTATGQVVQISSSGTISPVAMDTTARILVSGCYSV